MKTTKIDFTNVNKGDGVCDTTHGFGINAAHLAYPNSASTQTLGTNFAVKQLRG
jgi:hypothetical protein